MNDRWPPYSAVQPVDLARVADFSLGDMRVRPSACEIEIEGQAERLEPRVMQVLAALSRANGEVVSREDLIVSCWGDATIGDDAINRVLGKLRRLSERCAGRSFRVDTVPKIGYRLMADALSRADRKAAPWKWSAPFRIRRLRLIAAATGLAMAAALGAWVAWRTAQPALYSIERAELIIHSALKEEQPALSPNGQYILYVATPTNESGATADLYMQAVAGGEPLRLTNTPLYDEQAPTWSPDGLSIAFVRAVPPSVQDKPCRIFVRVAPVGEEREVGRCAVTYWTGRLAWDPSGQKLLFSDGAAARPNETYRFQWRIRELDVRTGETRERFAEQFPYFGDTNATFSADGKRIAFVRYGEGSSANLAVHDAGRRRLRRIRLDGAQAFIAWASDSRSLFVASNRFGPSDLWQVRADGRGAPVRMGLGPGGDIFRLSRAGDLLAFEHVTEYLNLTRLSATGRETAITTGNQRDLEPAYSSRGVLAFFRDQAGPSVYIQYPDQISPHRLVGLDHLRVPSGLRWSPDGSSLAFVASRDEGAHLFVLDRESGRLRELRTPGLEPRKPDWSLDGRSLIFFAGGGRGLRLWRLPVQEGAQPQEITGHNLANESDEVRELPEGLFVARELERNGVFRLDGARGPVLLTTETQARGIIPAWNVIRGKLYYIYAEDPTTPRLYWRPARGGSRTHFADISRRIHPIRQTALDIDPRTGDFVYSTIISQEDDIGLARLRRSRGSWSNDVKLH